MLNLINQILILLFLKMSSSWIEKYRPKHLKNIIGQNNIISTIKNMIKNKFTFKQISLAINKPIQEIKRIATSLNLI